MISLQHAGPIRNQKAENSIGKPKIEKVEQNFFGSQEWRNSLPSHNTDYMR